MSYQSYDDQFYSALQGPDPAPPVDPLEFFDIITHIGIFNILFILLIISMLFGMMSAKAELLNHWNVLIKGLSYSPQDFYQKLELELQKEGIEGLKISTKNLHEGGIISVRRQYATIRWHEYSYTVCASPFAHSFFVSYRSLGKASVMKSALARIPWLGKYLVKWFFPLSWYQEDTIMMFHTIVHESVVAVVNELTNEYGIERIRDQQAQPNVRDIFER